MNYSLRNRDRIRNALGSDVLDSIIDSLDYHFSNYPDVDKIYVGEKYNIIAVDYYGDSSKIVVLYIIRKVFNTYMLAFKEFVG